MGGARETALASSTNAPFTWRLLTFMGWNWKCHVIIGIKTNLSGFVVPMHSGLCEQYVKSPRANALGIWLPVSHAPSCIGTTNPSRTGRNPLITTRACNYIYHEVWDDITYPFQNFGGVAIEVRDWMKKSHTLLGIWLLIHAGIKINLC